MEHCTISDNDFDLILVESYVETQLLHTEAGLSHNNSNSYHEDVPQHLLLNKPDQTQTHHYDGGLKETEMVIIIKNFLDNERSVSIDKKKDVIDHFMKEILQFDVPQKNIVAVNFLHDISFRFTCGDIIPDRINYDETNEIHASDLLYICALEFNNMKLLFVDTHAGMTVTTCELLRDFCIELFIQLSDVGDGQCPQGRVVRLWQIVFSYYEYFNCVLL
jgi:hypothetical protein